MDPISNRSSATSFLGSAAFPATTSTAMPAPDLVPNALASSSHRTPDSNILLSLETFHANKRPRLSESRHPPHYATFPSSSRLSSIQHQALHNIDLQPPAFAPTPTPLPFPLSPFNPPQMPFLALSQRTHNLCQGDLAGLPKLIEETGLVIHPDDQGLLEHFLRATAEQEKNPAILFTYLNTLEVFSRWCRQQGLPGIWTAVDQMAVGQSVEKFQQSEIVCESAKSNIHHAIHALHQFCATGCPEIDRSALLSLRPDDQRFFVQYQLEKKLSQIQITALSCFLNWRNQQRLTGLQEWLNEPEERGNQSVEAFCEAEQLPQEAVKEVIGSAVQRLYEVLAETQNRAPGKDIPSPLEAFRTNKQPRLPEAEAHENSLLPLSTDRAIEAFQRRKTVYKSEEWDIGHTINALRQLSKDRYAAVSSYINKSNSRIPQVDEVLLREFHQAALQQGTIATVTSLIDTLRLFSRWCHQRGFLPLKILMMLGEAVIQNAVAPFCLDQKLSQPEKDSMNHTVSMLHQFCTEKKLYEGRAATENQRHPVQIEEQHQAQTLAWPSIFEQLPDLPSGQLIFDQTPLHEAFWHSR